MRQSQTVRTHSQGVGNAPHTQGGGSSDSQSVKDSSAADKQLFTETSVTVSVITPFACNKCSIEPVGTRMKSCGGTTCGDQRGELPCGRRGNERNCNAPDCLNVRDDRTFNKPCWGISSWRPGYRCNSAGQKKYKFKKMRKELGNDSLDKPLKDMAPEAAENSLQYFREECCCDEVAELSDFVST